MSESFPDLNQSISRFKSEILQMNRDITHGTRKPHKLVMLLAVLDLADKGLLQENKIFFDKPLFESFESIFNLIRAKQDWNQPAPPFFHLRTSNFWRHKVKAGRESFYNKIKTSGGGSKRILDNIEYAYLSEYAFQVIANESARKELREFLIIVLNPYANFDGPAPAQPLINQEGKSAMAIDRLGTIFHESFPLSRQSIFQIVKAIADIPNISSIRQSEREKLFQEKTSLGTRYIKAMPRYALGCGIIDSKYQLLPLGKSILVYDQLLDQTGTQWLMHYHLSAPHRPGPQFWSEIVSKRFYPGSVFSADDIVEQIGNFIWQTENKILSERAVRSTATVFLGTYTKPEGLGKLRLLEATDSGRYRVPEPAPAPVWAIGYALLDFWDAHYSGRLSIGLDTLQESFFPGLFFMGKADLDEMLQVLQEARYLELHRTAPPYQVVLLRQDREFLLQKLYGTN